DGTDLYWARARVLEQLQQRQGQLPAGVHPALGPDATGAGWVFEYALVDRGQRQSLADLRDLQQWYLRYQLETVPGVAEVATIGGFQREYQVELNPQKLRSYGISLATVLEKVRDSTGEVGGGALELSGARYMVQGLGNIASIAELEQVPLAVRDGVPIEVQDVATVGFAPALRDGAAEWNGEGEAVVGIVIMREGGSALAVIRGVKAKLAALRGALPRGVEVETAYDRSGLIEDSIATLRRDLIVEMIVVSLVIIVFLFHFRSALIPIITLPIALAATFLPMRYLHISSNIMSLGGLALAIGVLTDAAIVMVENGCRHLAACETPPSPAERQGLLLRAAAQVGPALFYSLLIIVVSFLPVFLLEAQSGRMFRPLAWTKTLSVSFASLLAITLVPALMLLLIRGRVPRERDNPVMRASEAVYRPLLRWCLRHPGWTLAFNLIFLAATLPLGTRLGSEFMPPLYEGAALYMPTSLPGLGITPAVGLLQQQDRILRAFPEVASVFGTVGRSDSATDNAPL
ncbi:MAG: efflux RND transporter permease subunit, partial [Terriglobales bacterium]